MTSLTIRKSKQSDFDKIFEIWVQNQFMTTGLELNPETEKQLETEMHNLFTNPHSIFSIAELDTQRVIGWQALTPLLSNPLVGKYTAQISTYIDQSASIPNLGSQLTENSISLARTMGIEHIYGRVKDNNIPANILGDRFSTHKFVIPNSSKKKLPNFNLYVIDIF